MNAIGRVKNATAGEGAQIGEWHGGGVDERFAAQRGSVPQLLVKENHPLLVQIHKGDKKPRKRKGQGPGLAGRGGGNTFKGGRSYIR